MQTPRNSCGICAFTVVELLVVFAIIAVLAGLILGVVTGSKRAARASQCMSNQKQLVLGWTLFTMDHDGALPPNSDTISAGRSLQMPSWVAGWLRTANEPGDHSDNRNAELLVAPAYSEFGSIGQYVGNPSVYLCPEDNSSRVRSTSMNAYMNGFGSWRDSNYVTFRSFADLRDPSSLWVFIDERSDSINDGYFAVEANVKYKILDYPANYHKGAAVISFADGHAEFHLWVEATTTPPEVDGEHLPINPMFTSSSDRDLEWLTTRATYHY